MKCFIFWSCYTFKAVLFKIKNGGKSQYGGYVYMSSIKCKTNEMTDGTGSILVIASISGPDLQFARRPKVSS
jgi:hypothetical protein